MKNPTLKSASFIILGIIIGVSLTLYLKVEPTYEEAMTLLKSKGDVVSQENYLTYIKGQYLGMDYEEVKALAVVSKGYESIAVMADESIIPRDSVAREAYYSTDDNGVPMAE